VLAAGEAAEHFGSVRVVSRFPENHPVDQD
jgi:hypothetical protein